MPRRNRYFESHQLYEICLRARTGLPLPSRGLITLLLKSALARTQRDLKVFLCHFIWMNNHAHMLVVMKDAKQAAAFYGELQKRITDYLKRLLDLSHLDLWEGAPSVIRIADIEAAKERIAYFYANPARACLVDSIAQFPGYSSYHAFQEAAPGIFSTHREKAPWIRCPDVPRAPCRNLSLRQEELLLHSIQSKNFDEEHELTTFPNLWMRCFSIDSLEEIREINQDIVSRLTTLEENARKQRSESGARTKGRNTLIRQPLMLPHTPEKRTRRILVIARDKTIRLAYINLLKNISVLCRECYLRWKCLDFAFSWPPGTFPPPIPLVANALSEPR